MKPTGRRLMLERIFRNYRDGYLWPRGEMNARIIGLCLAAAIAESEGD